VATDDENKILSKPESISLNMPGFAVLFGKEFFTLNLLPTY